jgi:hypothetical protein
MHLDLFCFCCVSACVPGTFSQLAGDTEQDLLTAVIAVFSHG